MSILNINNLPSKFQPFLIGSPTCPAKIKDEIDTIFQRPLIPLIKDYIFDAGKWILKLPRTEGNTAPDSHLYRVRKAEKIRNYIHQNNLKNDMVVPRKYIYWNTAENKFYAVAEKLKLSSEVATPASADIEADLKMVAEFGGQVQALANNAPKRSLTPTQAKALAELSILGYTDLTYNNLYFTPDGKVAIIDTEPVKRFLKKMRKLNYFFLLIGDRASLLCQQSIAGFAKLKSYIDNPTALKTVQRIERNHVLWCMAQLITKIFVVSLVIYFTPTITALIPIASVAETLRIGLLAVAILKNTFLIQNALDVYKLLNFSYQGLQGVSKIYDMEMKALL